MTETQGCLKNEKLRRLMEGELAAADVAEAEAHLSVCDHCRAMLDREIGNADWWQDARESLSGGKGDRPVVDEANSAHSDVLALLGPTDDPRMLGRIGPYEIIGILGRGGMGVVFKGFDGALNRYVAIKMLLPHLAASGAARKRFAREAQAAAAVVHDHVMAIHSVAEWQGVPYLVMPYGRGVSLQRRLCDHGPLEVREVLRIGMQTAAGLAAAHAQGLVHRDVKPANILLAEDVERVTLTDFGLARAVDDVSLTRNGALAGTPQYMSPEQARGKGVDARSDLFSLGSVLYAMCTGRAPFRADSSYGVLRLITDDEPTPIREINPEVPEWLCAIVSRLMAKRADDRFSSASEVAELLESCLAHVQQPTAAALPSSLSQPTEVSVSMRPNRLFKGVLVMVATLALGLAAMFAWQGSAPPDIAGEWTGEDWGAVVLEARQAGHYEGRFTNSDHAKAGSVRLKWSRLERRFNGTWEEGDRRSGRISLRLVGDEIRGAWTTDKESSKATDFGDIAIDQDYSDAGTTDKNSPKAIGTPRLADLLWKRNRGNTANNTDLELPRHKLIVTCFLGEVDSESNCSAKCFGDDVALDRSGKMICGSPENAAEIEWKFIGYAGDKDVYEFTVIAPRGSPDANTTKTEVQFGGRRTPVLRDSNRVIVLDSPESKAQAPNTGANTGGDGKPDLAPKRVQRIRTGPSVKTIAYSADGKRLAVANGDLASSVDILDAETGKTVVTLKLVAATDGISRDEATALTYSLDGNLLAVGTIVGQVKLFNPRTGELVRALDDEPDRRAGGKIPENLKSLSRALGSVASLAFSPDGSLLAMCGRSLRDVSLVAGEPSWDGCSATELGRLKVWEVKTGTLKYDLAGHRHANAVAFSNGGDLMASAGSWENIRERGTGVILWNPRNGAKIRTLKIDATESTRSVAFSLVNEQLVAIGSQRFDKDQDTSTGVVSVANLGSGMLEWQQTIPGSAKPVAFLPDGKSVAVLCDQRSIRFLDTMTGTVKHEIQSADDPQGGRWPESGRWNDFATALNSGMLATGGEDLNGSGRIELWEIHPDETLELRSLGIGKIAPDIEGEDLNGVAFKLSDYRGKVVMISFWATWCGPCMAELPHERELVKRFEGRPFVLIGVNADADKGDVTPLLEEKLIPWRSFWCGDKGPLGPIPRAWNVNVLPTVYLVDHAGVIQAKELKDGILEQLVAEAEQAANSGAKP